MSAPQTLELVSNHASDEQVTAFFRRYLPDFYFVNTSLSRMRRHLILLERLPQKPLQIEWEQSASAGFTELTLCARDELRPGWLAKVASVLATLKINVHTAWIHTLRDPHDVRQPRPVVLDTFLLSEPYFGRTRVLTAKTKRSLTQALTDVLGERTVESRPARIERRMGAPLGIHQLEAHPNGEFLIIKLRAADAGGVLFRLTHALASLGLLIAHAQINTYEQEHAVDDVFFVSKTDEIPVSSGEAPDLVARLRSILESELVM